MKTIVNYAQKVKEQHALNKTLAPVETDLTSASKAYAVGQKFIHDGVLYQAKTAIAQGAALVLNTNYEAADDVSSEIEALTKEVAATLNTLGAKNFLETLIGSGTTQGVTYTINADGSITLNGTCTAWTNIKLDYIAGQKNIPSGSYILNGSISGNNKFRLNTYVDGTKMAESENGNEASFTIPSTATEVYTRFEIDSTATFNNETFYPMIRLSSIEDDTYAPYAKTNRELTAENQTLTNNLSDEVETRAKLGAKNVFNPNLSTIATSANYYPNTSVTVGSDKQITVDSTSDTAGSYSYKNIVLANNDSFNLEKGIEYIISGLETDDNATYFALFRAYDSSNNEILSIAVGSAEASFTLPSNTATYSLVLCVGRTVSLSKTFYVMFRLSTDSDTTYQPYAMTNRELTASMLKTKLFGNIAIDSLTLAAGASGDVKKNAANISYADLGLKAGSIKAVIFTWSTGHVCVPTQIYASGGNNIVLSLYNPSSSSVTVTQVDLQVFYTE